jgi:hypothetical protein
MRHVLHRYWREAAGEIYLGRQVDQRLFIPGQVFMTKLAGDLEKFDVAWYH